jgi:hypothetical protein
MSSPPLQRGWQMRDDFSVLMFAQPARPAALLRDLSNNRASRFAQSG